MSIWSKITGFASKDLGKSYDASLYAMIDVEVGLRDYKIHDIGVAYFPVALEQAGYLERGNNVPHVYATGITVKNMNEARRRISESALFSNDEIEQSVRADSKDISAYLHDIPGNAERKALTLLDNFTKIERYILNQINNESLRISYKQLNDFQMDYKKFIAKYFKGERNKEIERNLTPAN